MNRLLYKWALAVFILSTFFLAVAPTYAQTSAGLQLKPAVVEDQVNPGEVHQYTLSVTNVGKAAGIFYIHTLDIKGVDDGGRPIFSNHNEITGYELSSWMSVPLQSVSLGTGESKTISFSVHIPTDASPGSHFASILFNDKPTAPTSSGTGVGFDVGAIVSLRISGDIHEEAQLREFSTDKLIYGTPNVTFTSKVENLGNVLVQPSGSIQITSMFGRQVANIPVNELLASVFPKANRTYTTKWASDTFAFGRYEAVVSLVYGSDARKTIYSTTSFWVLPIIPICIILGGVLVIIITIFALMKAYIRKQLRQMGVTKVTKADSDFYKKKYQKSVSKLVIVAMAMLLVCVVFLVLMFVLFA